MKFYFIDKPLGLSSFDVIRVLRKKLNTSKMGHTGTLDPLATGGLLIAVGKYTKLIPFFEKDKKTYEFEVSLDGNTASFDLGEEVQYISNDSFDKFKKELNLNKIKKIINDNFLGEIEQVPPKYSALKIGGKKAYDLARDGIDFEIKARRSTIYSIEILDYNYPKINIRAEVSAGTYIRSIASDLGQILGTGGYITKLRRTKIGKLDISLSQDLENFDIDKYLEEKLLFDEKDFITLDESTLSKINNGLKIYSDFDYPIGKKLFVFDGNNITNIVEYNGEYLKAIRKI